MVQLFINWLRKLWNADLPRTKEGWFIDGKSKRKSKQPSTDVQDMELI